MPNDRLRTLRRSRDVSRRQLAAALGISFYTVGRWERGDALPSAALLQKLCAFFALSSDELGFSELAEDTPLLLLPDTLAGEQTTATGATTLYDPAIPALLAHGLIGRDAVLAQLQLCLLDTPSLLAVHGLPGVGKTALATAVAHNPDLRAHFVDGIFWAGLGPQPNLLGLLSRWGALLGITTANAGVLTGLESWSKAVRTAIGSRRFLIVIDDAWTLEDALACKVGGINCRHLVTTRFPAIAAHLTVNGALQLHELSAEHSIDLLQSLAPTFTLTEVQKGLDLVQAVGGLPLALYLMGNYLRTHAYSGKTRRVQTLLQSLEDVEVRLRLSQPQNEAESHPGLSDKTSLSLQSIIAVTDQFLSQEARTAFYALSILPAKPTSFSEEVALAVANCSTDELDTLSDSGLLECSGTNRYLLHQVIADYAHIQLDQAALAQAGQRLIAYVLAYIETHKKAYEQLEEETSTITAALELAYTLRERTALIKGICSFAPYLILRGFYGLAEHHLKRAYDTAAALHDRQAMVDGILLYLGEVAQKQGKFDQSQAYFQEGLDLARELGDEEHTCELLTDYGALILRRGSYVEAKNYLYEALSLARKLGRNDLVHVILKSLGSVFSALSDFKQAEITFNEGLELATLMDDRANMCILLGNLGVLAALQGQQLKSAQYFEEGLHIARQIGHREQMCVILLNLGDVKRYEKEYRAAESFFREGLLLARQIGHREWISALTSDLAASLWHLGNVAEAEQLLAESLPLARQIGRPEMICNALNEYGTFYIMSQRIDEAEKCFLEMLEIAAEDDKGWYGLSQYGLARVAVARNDIAMAQIYGERSLKALEPIGYGETQEIKDWVAALNS
ncbi:tetratricopeptide repeat protein [Dictyobacter arantiisoli]|nr:tetratricopeptide repeat protein [Dictyobacter arantiisoli]